MKPALAATRASNVALVAVDHQLAQPLAVRGGDQGVDRSAGDTVSLCETPDDGGCTDLEPRRPPRARRRTQSRRQRRPRHAAGTPECPPGLWSHLAASHRRLGAIARGSARGPARRLVAKSEGRHQRRISPAPSLEMVAERSPARHEISRHRRLPCGPPGSLSRRPASGCPSFGTPPASGATRPGQGSKGPPDRLTTSCASPGAGQARAPASAPEPSGR